AVYGQCDHAARAARALKTRSCKIPGLRPAIALIAKAKARAFFAFPDPHSSGHFAARQGAASTL
ncbi:MAG TPA: hypothetical protein VK110_06780, partial [Salinisphaeraceae bacterium]|nr:hypothetical protein [Salinisphaeraceae bacterium]